MSIFLPEVVKDIIYSYIHEIKTEDIKNELISKLKRCERCDEDVVVHKKINQHYCSCGEFVCTNCHDDLLYLQNESNQGYNFIQCLCCLEMTDDESLDEDAIWQEMYGIVCWSQIY
jgi:transposase-like protein